MNFTLKSDRVVEWVALYQFSLQTQLVFPVTDFDNNNNNNNNIHLGTHKIKDNQINK